MEEVQDNNNGPVRPREEDDDEDNFRNVRRNIDEDDELSNVQDPLEVRKEPFCENEVISMVNMEMIRSHTADVVHRRPFNPSSDIISLNELLTNGSQHGKNILVIILSITSAAGNSNIQVQQRYNGNRGQVNSIRYDRRMVIICPFSDPGKNTAMILFGVGCCDRFFDGDISLRDNGVIRKLNANFDFYLLFCLMLFYFFNFSYLRRSRYDAFVG